MVVALGLPMNGVRPAKTWLAVDNRECFPVDETLFYHLLFAS
jgi:hypothetical protein